MKSKPTRKQLEEHLDKYVELKMYDGVILKGILYKTGDKRFTDSNLKIPRNCYFVGKDLKIADNTYLFKVSHIARIIRSDEE